jgi:hypothetical protein
LGEDEENWELMLGKVTDQWVKENIIFFTEHFHLRSSERLAEFIRDGIIQGIQQCVRIKQGTQGVYACITGIQDQGPTGEEEENLCSPDDKMPKSENFV